MPSILAARQLKQELAVICRFGETYRRKFESLIDQMNRAQPPSELQCIRLCVEAVDMMLASQTTIAKALDQLNAPVPM